MGDGALVAVESVGSTSQRVPLVSVHSMMDVNKGYAHKLWLHDFSCTTSYKPTPCVAEQVVSDQQWNGK